MRCGDELDRAEALGLDGLVMHPGIVHVGNGRGRTAPDRRRPRRDAGVTARRKDADPARAHGRTGDEPRASIRTPRRDHRPARRLAARRRLPRHLPPAAAGYDICSEAGYRETFRQFGAIVGFSRLKAFHMNDSKKPCGSRVDRHEHIGKGCLGLAPFRRIVQRSRGSRSCRCCWKRRRWIRRRAGRLSDIDPLDKMNLDVLRRLIQSPKTSAAKR